MNIEIRPYRSQDSISDITKLLQRSYQRLADLGLRYTATWQDDNTTRERVLRGQTYLAFAETRLVGTITLENQCTTKGCSWYDRPEAASFHQFAVDPSLQGKGIGTKLLKTCETEARKLGAQELALDTAEWAYHLISMYLNQGYRFVDETQWETTNYRSVIMSKDLYSKINEQKPVHEFLRDQPSEQFSKMVVDLERQRLDVRQGKELASLLSRLGEGYRNQGNFIRALACFEQASSLCIQGDLPQLLFVNRLRTAIAYQYANQFEISAHIFKQLLREEQLAHAPSSHLDFLHQHFGKLLVEIGNFAEASLHLQMAMDLRVNANADPALLDSSQQAIQHLNLRLQAKA